MRESTEEGQVPCIGVNMDYEELEIIFTSDGAHCDEISLEGIE